MSVTHEFDIVIRYLNENGGWDTIHHRKVATYSEIMLAAQDKAMELDKRFGGDHYWSVAVVGPAGTMYELYHDRLA